MKYDLSNIKSDVVLITKNENGQWCLFEEAKSVTEMKNKLTKLISDAEKKIKAEDEKVTRYMNTYSGKRLLEAYHPDEYATWQVYGEDPNAELTGPHHQEHLGNVEGKLKDVIKYAVNLKGFWAWGGGGDIRRLDKPLVIKV